MTNQTGHARTQVSGAGTKQALAAFLSGMFANDDTNDDQANQGNGDDDDGATADAAEDGPTVDAYAAMLEGLLSSSKE